MNDDASNADAIGSVGDSCGAVAKQGATLPGAIYRETGEQSDWDNGGYIRFFHEARAWQLAGARL